MNLGEPYSLRLSSTNVMVLWPLLTYNTFLRVMAKKLPELEHSYFDALLPGEVSMRVPILQGAVQMHLTRYGYTKSAVIVHIDGGPEPPPTLISVRRKDGQPIQIRGDMGHPAFKRPVDKVNFARSESGIWAPDLKLELDNRFSFIRFANLIVAYATSKQQKASERQ